MATYLQVSSDLAGRVARGLLAAGEELPSVREAARQYGTTTTTVARAYRRLSDAGVIDVSDRRRSRVATAGESAARWLLDDVHDESSGSQAALRLAGSDDPGLDIVLRSAGTERVLAVGARGSFHGLTGLWRGTADAAAIHLRHRSGTHNSPFAQTLLRGRQPALIHLWRREQGLLTPAGNPARVAGVADLRGLRVARRQFGAGTRVLLDQLLASAGIPAASVAGPEAASHLEVAIAIAAGQADTGLGVRAAATALDLGFTPVTWEDFDIVLSAAALEAAEPLIAALRDPAVQSAVDSLGGYDLSETGTVRLLG
jgi:molybdate-binding protein